MTDTPKDCFDEIEIDCLSTAISYYIRVLNLWVSRDLEKKLSGSPLAGGTGKVSTLFIVEHQPGITASEIRQFAGKDAPAMTRLVDKLITDGLLDRRPDPETKRRQQLFITDKGRTALDEVRGIVGREPEEAFWMLTAEEHAQTVALLRKIAAAYVERHNGLDWKRNRS
ncbi:MAG: MarR family winged helix-turn-helix transcriptional regulator [Sagittula sp.]|jgi:DNA-binding MarR family transcriptional regulator|uniref:MarR family winged helix-turn-helix transcriptional regulator n=1 Tax=unclassified Sagittula TaxID=2624628 RepID=UPI0024C37B52|nr:MarR family transcriptional regulator [Sagittula sp. MA-2]WHZ34425.1 MarR family transcriptional regulator [Sagittula sp. MA-2]